MKKTVASLLVLALFLTQGTAWAENNALKGGGKVEINFHDVDIKDIVLAISQITGKNFIVDDKVRGKITIVSATPVSVEEAYQVFLTALNTKGFTTEQVGSVTKIISNDDAMRSGIPNIGPESETPASSGQIITKIVPLQFIDANQIQQALRTMVSRSGSIVGYGPTNSLMITDTVVNIQRLEGMISKLDKQTFENSVEVIPIKHAQADDIAQKLLNIFNAEKKGGAGGIARRDNIEGGAAVTSIMPDTRSNSLIVMATRKGIERTLDLLAELDRPLNGKGKSGIHIVRLKHAKADELAQTLGSLFSGSVASSSKSKSPAKSSSSSSPSPSSSSGLAGPDGGASAPAPVVSSSGGSDLMAGIFQGEVRVVADNNTNSLIVTAAPNDFEAMGPIIEQLDSRRAQVLVESLIMEVRMGKNLSAGLSLHNAAGGGGLGAIAATGMNPIAPLGVAEAIKGLAGGLGGLMIGATTERQMTLPGTNMSIPIGGATFKALQANNFINVLSSPNIMTTDNKKAEIAVGKNIPLTSPPVVLNGSAAPIQQTTREKVELKLAVTPQINEGDEVTLEVEQIIQEIDKSEVRDTQGNPTTSERRTLTTIVANDSQTVVIGGLISDKEEKAVKKVPLLGDVPLVGYLFRDTQVIKEKTNLLLFLTPHIIREPADMTRVSVARNNQRKAFNKANGIPESKALYDYELDKGLNMAPPPSSVKKPAPKRFDYENYEDASIDPSEGSGSSESLARGREERRPTNSVESARSGGAKARPASNSGNPFAEIRPPSSGTN